MARPAKLNKKLEHQLIGDITLGVYTVRELSRKYGVGIATVMKYKKSDYVEQRKEEYDEDGFLYVIYIEDSSKKKFFKIGIAKNLEARIKQHQTSSPFIIKVALSFYVDRMRKMEQKLHETFKDKNINGEWFDLSKNDLLAIKDEVSIYGIF